MRGLAIMPLWLICLIPATGVDAAEYHSQRHGFSLSYPKDWMVASKEQRDLIKQEARAALDKMDNVDLDKVAVFIFDPEPGEFAENINVVVGPGGGRINSQEVKKYGQALIQQFSQMGLDPTNLQTEQITIGNRQAISVHFDMKFPGSFEKIRQWQVVVPVGEKVYVVTCSALASNFNRVEPLFKQSVNSLRIKDGSNDGLSRILQFTLVGALIGGLGGLVVWLFQKKSRKQWQTEELDDKI